jgi:hypothetical protein
VVWWRAVCAGAARRRQAKRARDRPPKCGASRASPVSVRWRGGNRRRVRRSGCGRGRVYRRRRWRRLRRGGKRRGVHGSGVSRDDERVDDNVFQGREDACATRGWRERAPAPAGLPSACATLRPPPGPQGRECSPLLAHLSGFARTLFAFARNATPIMRMRLRRGRNAAVFSWPANRRTGTGRPSGGARVLTSRLVSSLASPQHTSTNTAACSTDPKEFLTTKHTNYTKA